MAATERASLDRATPPVNTGSIRNPRRRQRNDSESARNQPRRKRSKLSDDTFAARDSGSYRDGPEVDSRGETAHLNGYTASLDGNGYDLAVRSKKPSLKRQPRGDGAQVLTTNANYTVKSLPSTPRELRRGSVEFRGSICQASGLALAVTRTEALIWEYGSHSAVSNPRVFGVPFTVPEGEALPFGKLVAGGGTSDTGLVLLDANTGKVVFLESIERAANLGLFEGQEKQRGVEGTIPGFFSGETVVDFVDADTAGFIATLSSGRLAQITLRDVQGKARVQAQILRESSSERSGWAATFKGFLGAGAWKVDVAAVHARSLGARGQMQVLAATENGVCKVWDLDWSGRAEHRGNVDIREILVHELKATMSAEQQGSAEPVAVMDFAFVGDHGASPSKDLEIKTVATDKPVDLLILTRTGPSDVEQFFLVEVTLSGNIPEVKQVIALKTREPSRKSTSPRLVLPKQGHTAYVVFADSVVIATIPNDASDPEAQLHDESYIEPESFEDVVYLRKEKGMAFLDAQAENTRSRQASCFGFVRGAGLVRFSANDGSENPGPSRVSVKSKLEQAVFYGMLQDNILDLARHSVRFDNLDEIEDAAVALSADILRSDGEFISKDPTSIEAHLERRAQAVNALVRHLRQSYPALSKKTMWRLLWDAEKIAAGQQLWKTWEKYLAVASQGRRKKSTLLHECCNLLQSLHPYDLPPNAGQDDQVRAMFVSRLEYIDKLLPWAHSVLRDIQQDESKGHDEILRLAAEVNDMWRGTLETTFAFRTEHAQLYDIPPDSMPEGILLDAADYEGLPEFWTSSDAMVKDIVKMAELMRETPMAAYEAQISDASNDIVKRVASENPQMIQLMCLVFQERINWLQSLGSQKWTHKSAQLKQAYVEQRAEQITALPSIGQTGPGMDLAEKHRDFSTLTQLLVGEAQYLDENIEFTTGEARIMVQTQQAAMERRLSKCFSRYGDEWANAFFDVGFAGGRAATVLNQGHHNWPKALTKYLRADPMRAKVCWINDITSEEDFGQATKALRTAAHRKDERLWYKKVELSMAKLSMLAADEAKGAAQVERIDRSSSSELKLIEIQEKLYRHVLPEVLHALDQHAELQLGMERFAMGSKDIPSFLRLLEMGMSKLLPHRSLTLEELIDLLTLMDSVQSSNPDTNIAGEEFLLALSALEAVAPELPSKRLESLLRVVWKRAFLATNWTELNKMATKRSEADTAALLADTAIFGTLLAGKKIGLFPIAPNTNHDAAIRPLPPHECIGAASNPSDLAHRFSADVAEAIAHDNQAQDQELVKYIDTARLSHWVQDCERLAQRAWEEEVEEDAAQAARQREFDESVIEVEERQTNGNGHLNGHVDGYGIKVEEDERDGVVFGEDADVMEE